VPPCFRAPQAKKNVSQNPQPCQAPFSFFIYFFQQNKLKNQAIPTKKTYKKNITLIFSALKTIGSKKTSA